MKKSAGILAWHNEHGTVKVLLVHPGGPFYARKDNGAWSIPKGEYVDGEEPLAAAKREFAEELGMEISGTFTELSPVKLKSGKMVFAWAVETFLDMAHFKSNTFSMEWPPRTGKTQEFPEVDKAEWFTITEAKAKINAGQAPLLDELQEKIAQANRE
jgi:predicted NUDIX family NTP pyrophosphohydrolase